MAACCAYGQKGIPPRATPGDYQAHGQAGSIAIGAEFMGHSVPTPDSVYTNENFVAVEVGIFGQGQAVLSTQDFSLRINGKKVALPAQPFAAVFKGLKDPEWVPPGPPGEKSKGGISTGGGGQADGEPKPAPPKMPLDLERAMDQKVQKASLPEGERPLPAAGLIYFEFSGKLTGIRSLELIYAGPAGKATIPLQ